MLSAVGVGIFSAVVAVLLCRGAQALRVPRPRARAPMAMASLPARDLLLFVMAVYCISLSSYVGKGTDNLPGLLRVPALKYKIRQ